MNETNCKSFRTETTQGIIHKFCENPYMMERNKGTSGKPLPCMGTRCGLADYGVPANDDNEK
jgi:hypothetical protein